MESDHRLEVFQRNALGFFSKRDDKQSNDVAWFVGTVFKCATCPLMMFESPGYTTVDVEMMDYRHLSRNERRAIDV